MSKVTNIELKNDKTGNEMKVTTFDTGEKVFVNSKWDAQIYTTVVDGAEFEVVKEGEYNKIKYEKVGNLSKFGRPAGFGQVTPAQKHKDETISKAQDRKEDSFMVSATFRDATSITLAELSEHPVIAKEFQDRWLYWRGWLQDHYSDQEPKGVE